IADLRLRTHGAEGQRPVLDVHELRVALLAVDLQVRQHGAAARTPVDDVGVTIYQLLVPQPHEDLAHRTRQALVHREAQPRPVARGAEALELADDGPTGLFLPLPHALDEGLAAEVFLALALRRQ